MTVTRTEDTEGRDDRGWIEMSHLRYPWQRWFIAGAGRFETNESLGLELRSQVGGIAGPRLVNSNRAQLMLGAGLAFDDERGVDVEPTQNVEGLFALRWSYYTYDRPKTNVDLATQYYPVSATSGVTGSRLTPPSGANCGRISSSRSACTTHSTAARRIRTRTRTTSVSCCRSAGAIEGQLVGETPTAASGSRALLVGFMAPRTTSTGQLAIRTTRSATLPSSK
jgi:hypothetical protein